jgi:hypothetical protein
LVVWTGESADSDGGGAIEEMRWPLDGVAGGVDGGGAEVAHGVLEAEEQGQPTLDADLAVDGLDVGVEGVGREAETVGELLLAIVRVEAAEDDPFAFGEAFEGFSKDLGTGVEGEEAFEEFGELAGDHEKCVGGVGGEALVVGVLVDKEDHAVAVIDGAGEDEGLGEGAEALDGEFGEAGFEVDRGAEGGGHAGGERTGLEADVDEAGGEGDGSFAGGDGSGGGVEDEFGRRFGSVGGRAEDGEGEGFDGQRVAEVVGNAAGEFEGLGEVGERGRDGHEGFDMRTGPGLGRERHESPTLKSHIKRRGGPDTESRPPRNNRSVIPVKSTLWE